MGWEECLTWGLLVLCIYLLMENRRFVRKGLSLKDREIELLTFVSRLLSKNSDEKQGSSAGTNGQ